MRRSTRSEKVVKSISIALAAMVAGTTVMGSMGTMTVYAAESENEDKGESAPTVEETVETASEKAEYADETAKSEEATPEQKEEAVADAVEAVAAAADAIADVAKAVSTEAEMQNNDSAIISDDEKKEIESIESTVNEDFKKQIENFNAAVEADQKVVDEVTVDGLEVTTKENETEKTKDLSDYVAEKAKKAEQAKIEAYKALKDALAVKTNEVNQEVRDRVDAVKEAAAKAEAEAQAAEEVYSKANNSYESAVDEYNKYAVLYGEPLYGETEVTYDKCDEDVLNKYGITLDPNTATNDKFVLAKYAKIEEINGQKSSINEEVDLAEKEQTIKAQEQELANLKTNLDGAKEAAGIANAAVELVKEIPVTEPVAEVANEPSNSENNNLIEYAQTKLTDAQKDLNEAQKNYDTAKEKLDSAKETLSWFVTNNINLDGLKRRIAEAEKELKAAEEKLNEAKESAQTAQVYSTWAEELVKEQKAQCYVCMLEDRTGIDDSDDNVKSRPTKNYESVSPTEGKKVVKQTVPYDVYKQYVSWLVKGCPESSQIKSADLPTGKGIATGENSEKSSLGVIYWETENGKIKLDDNGQAILHYDAKELKADHQYFIAYTFKHEKDGYHFDGVYYTVKENKEDITEGEDDSILPDDLPSIVTEGEDDPSPTTIDDQPVALAAGVLGADRARTVENADEQIMVDQNGDVLGADRTPTGDVLGAERERGGDVLGAGRPQTGDYTNTGIALFGAVASGMMLLGYGLKKKKEDEAEKC